MNKVMFCLECGDKIVGRLDKKFCDESCRNTYNNKRKRESEKQIIEINRIQRKNRKILKMLNPEGKTTVRKRSMIQFGFAFKYHTHTYTSPAGNTYKFCYEYGYMELDDGIKVLIINEQPYM